MNDQNIPAGWYQDPTDTTKNRYWDGNAWTDKAMLIPQPVSSDPRPAHFPPPSTPEIGPAGSETGSLPPPAGPRLAEPDTTLGVTLRTGTTTIQQVQAESLGAAAGLQVSDRLLSVQGQLVGTASDIAPLIASLQVGDELAMQVARKGEVVALTTEVTSPPPLVLSFEIIMDPTTLEVRSTQETGFAAVAGVRVGDQIMAVNDQFVASPEDVRMQLDEVTPGEIVTFQVTRSGSVVSLQSVTTDSMFVSATTSGQYLHNPSVGDLRRGPAEVDPTVQSSASVWGEDNQDPSNHASTPPPPIGSPADLPPPFTAEAPEIISVASLAPILPMSNAKKLAIAGGAHARQSGSAWNSMGWKRQARFAVIGILGFAVLIASFLGVRHWWERRWITEGLQQYTVRDEAAFTRFVNFRTDASMVQLIPLGDLVCADIRQGKNILSVAFGISDISSVNASAVILAGSVKYMCPDQLKNAREQAQEWGFPDSTKDLFR